MLTIITLLHCINLKWLINNNTAFSLCYCTHVAVKVVAMVFKTEAIVCYLSLCLNVGARVTHTVRRVCGVALADLTAYV